MNTNETDELTDLDLNLEESSSDLSIDDIDLRETLEVDSNLIERKTSRSSGAATDYQHLWDLYTRSRERVLALDSDPNAFISPDGYPDLMAIKLYKEILGETRKMLETLNKIRNSDQVMVSALESHTRVYAENLAVPLGDKLRVVLQLLEKDKIEAQQVLCQLLQRGLVDVFKRAAGEALKTTKETYGLE
jgi:hypothetical protein